MEIIIYSPEAICSIIIDCYNVRHKFETGGILVGPKAYKRIITDVIPSSVYAERGTATYFQSEQDVEILNQQLKGFQSGGYDFKGYYHKHPSGMFNLSYGDKATCSEILRDPNYKINNYLIMCIVTQSAVQPFPMFSYAVSLTNHLRVNVSRNEIKILPRTCVLECAECFEPSFKGARYGHNDTEQYFRGIKEKATGNSIRASRKRESDRMLSERKVGAQKDRHISKKQRVSPQQIKR